MPTGTASNHFKYALATGTIDLSTDSIKILLVRSGYTFEKDDVAKLVNITVASASQTLTVEADDDSITGSSGDFVSKGFIPGNLITTDLVLNPGPYIIDTVIAAKITVLEALQDEGPIAAKIVTSEDELATGFGYIQDTKVLAGVAVVEDDTNDRAELTCNTITWTATGGSIGPTPGAILYDDTSADNTVIGYIDFGAEMTAADGADFTISNLKIRLT